MAFKLTFDKLKIDTTPVAQSEINKLCKQEIENTIAHISSASLEGADADGNSFEGYSTSYLAQIAKGISGKSSSGVVNLRQTGEMMQSFQQIDVADGAEARFLGGDAALKAQFVEEGGRPFVFFGQEDEARIEQAFEELVTNASEKILT